MPTKHDKQKAEKNLVFRTPVSIGRQNGKKKELGKRTIDSSFDKSINTVDTVDIHSGVFNKNSHPTEGRERQKERKRHIKKKKKRAKTETYQLQSALVIYRFASSRCSVVAQVSSADALPPFTTVPSSLFTSCPTLAFTPAASG